MKLKKYAKNPILSPNPKNPWESLVVCNPGAWYENGVVQLLYRAAGNDPEHKIHFGLAASQNGFDFKRVSDRPVLSPSADGCDAGCVEDPRIVKMGKYFYITYAYRPFPPGRYWESHPDWNPFGDCADAPRFFRENLTMSGLLISRDLRNFQRVGPLTGFEEDDRDVILFPEKIDGRYVMLHRPSEWIGPAHGCEKPSIWISAHDSLLGWPQHRLLAQSRYDWEFKKIGGSTPPIKTKAGWLFLHHGVDRNHVYRAGAMMLDLKDPCRVIARTPEPILEPEHDYETQGSIIANVVFPTGNVVIGDTLFVYYGGADQFIGVATAPLQDLVDHVMSHPVG